MLCTNKVCNTVLLSHGLCKFMWIEKRRSYFLEKQMYVSLYIRFLRTNYMSLRLSIFLIESLMTQWFSLLKFSKKKSSILGEVQRISLKKILHQNKNYLHILLNQQPTINSMRLRLRSTHNSVQIFHGEFRKLFPPIYVLTFHQPLFFTTEFPHRREENRVIFQLQEEEKQERKFSLQKSNKPYSHRARVYVPFVGSHNTLRQTDHRTSSFLSPSPSQTTKISPQRTNVACVPTWCAHQRTLCIYVFFFAYTFFPGVKRGGRCAFVVQKKKRRKKKKEREQRVYNKKRCCRCRGNDDGQREEHGGSGRRSGSYLAGSCVRVFLSSAEQGDGAWRGGEMGGRAGLRGRKMAGWGGGGRGGGKPRRRIDREAVLKRRACESGDQWSREG